MSRINTLKHFLNQKGVVSLLLVIVLMLVSIVFAFTHSAEQSEGELIINVSNFNAPRFVEDTEVKDAISKMNLDKAGVKINSIKDIEQKLNEIQFVREAQVSKDIKNNLVIDIEQDRPIARVITPSGKSTYINQDGKLIGLSKKYSARVVLITGKGAEKLLDKKFLKETAYGTSFLEFVNTLSNDRFWNAQITQLEIQPNMDIVAYPQVGKERIEFGLPTGYTKKLGKLKLYYNSIVANKGWNVYRNIKLQYEGQIVCN
ncbi:hypothetical protein KMW28_16130 [Flammeovirga yaeyamensis]|uniref:Cell division protein FtsQ n=1 Tax=Flammeovirga yaeyamensis TaxID=367791 RepID=A0AAX1N0Y9_9BACT|nr:hypothetical protein [Flammeovirga yaeyamensis]MBB3698462.1 cell division protein FtsQ [Flammeovirga yaeyamensis]NMF34189.1 hypothetical protein [Flammeovirga yaeyamensis]QWG01174.1 hypothetical protein KMW28_16130 [Flammeovirga yaeyamensis]